MPRIFTLLIILSISSACALRLGGPVAPPQACDTALQAIQAEYLTQTVAGLDTVYEPSFTSSATALYRRLEGVVIKFRWAIAYAHFGQEEPGKTLLGRTIPTLSLVVIEYALPTDGRLEVLAHEVGHLVQPWHDSKFQNPEDRVIPEIWAETVGVAVLILEGRSEGLIGSVKYLRQQEPNPAAYSGFLDAYHEALCEAVAEVRRRL